jgi:hypothetical protein
MVDDAANTGTGFGGRRNEHRFTMWWMARRALVLYTKCHHVVPLGGQVRAEEAASVHKYTGTL